MRFMRVANAEKIVQPANAGNIFSAMSSLHILHESPKKAFHCLDEKKSTKYISFKTYHMKYVMKTAVLSWV